MENTSGKESADVESESRQAPHAEPGAGKKAACQCRGRCPCECCGGGNGGHGEPGGEKSAREVLDLRYAEGKISRDEYRQMKEDLE